jgi:uncharacterized protein YecT (DUF1311 family)
MIDKRIVAAAGVALSLAAPTAAASLAIEPRAITDQTPTYAAEVAYAKTGHAAIDAVIEAWAQDARRDFLELAKEAGGQAGPWSLDVDYEIARNDAAMFVVVFIHDSYTGGAHPNAYTRTFNFMMPDGIEVELPDLFTPSGVALISDLAVAQLRQRLLAQQMSDADWIRRGAGPNGRNFRSFVLKPDSLTLHFDTYQVAPYAAGPQEVTIPLAKLKATLQTEPRAPKPSFDCAQAASEVELAICSSRELARLDRHLGEAYAAKLSLAEDEVKRSAIRKEQRAWVRERDAACLRAALALEACITGLYRARLRMLEGGG